MPDEWYYAHAEKPIGPFSLRELKTALQKRADWKEQLVWRPGFESWMRAGSVPEVVVQPPPLPNVPPPLPNASVPDREPIRATSSHKQGDQALKWKKFLLSVLALVVTGLISTAADEIAFGVRRPGRMHILMLALFAPTLVAIWRDTTVSLRILAIVAGGLTGGIIWIWAFSLPAVSSVWSPLLIGSLSTAAFVLSGLIAYLICTAAPAEAKTGEVAEVSMSAPPLAEISKPSNVEQKSSPNSTIALVRALAIVLVVITAFIGLALSGGIGRELGRTLINWYRGQTASQDELQRALARGVEETKRRLPYQADAVTTLVDVNLMNLSVTYVYEVDESRFRVAPDAARELRTRLISVVCAPEIRRSMEAGAWYWYVYRDRKGRDFAIFDFEKSSCNNR